MFPKLFYALKLFFLNCCLSNTDDDEIDPSNKAVREKERRQANNVRERYVKNY